MEVLISDNCGATWTSLFNKAGTTLSYGRVSGDADVWGYFPDSMSEWHTETIPLGNYANKDIMIRFKDINDSGNNLFLDEITVSNSISLATSEINKDGIKVYPNPTTDKVMVTGLAKGTGISLYNVAGQKILNTITNGDTVIDMSGLVQGLYFIKTTKASVKIIKK